MDRNTHNAGESKHCTAHEVIDRHRRRPVLKSQKNYFTMTVLDQTPYCQLVFSVFTMDPEISITFISYKFI